MPVSESHSVSRMRTRVCAIEAVLVGDLFDVRAGLCNMHCVTRMGCVKNWVRGSSSRTPPSDADHRYGLQTTNERLLSDSQADCY